MKKKKANPRTRPATMADVKRAKHTATADAVRRMLYLLLYILIDNHGASNEDIKQLAEEINYYCDSISEGRLTWKDMERVVRDEYGIELPW